MRAGPWRWCIVRGHWYFDCEGPAGDERWGWRRVASNDTSFLNQNSSNITSTRSTMQSGTASGALLYLANRIGRRCSDDREQQLSQLSLETL
jgi:hypothetical protein